MGVPGYAVPGVIASAGREPVSAAARRHDWRDGFSGSRGDPAMPRTNAAGELLRMLVVEASRAAVPP